jgi:DNA polymerase-3 subunit epsilon
MNKWAFVDLETTGGSFTEERITEIGIVIMEEGRVTTVYETLVNPEKSISPFILNLTGIREEDLWRAPRFREIMGTVHGLLADAVFVAHNASFDRGFLRAEFKRCGLDWNPPTLCTVRLSRRLFPQYRRHNLDEVMARFSIPCRARHRALGDAQVLVDFWRILESSFPPALLNRTVNELCGKKLLA